MKDTEKESPLECLSDQVEVKKRMEKVFRKKRKTLPSTNSQIIEYLVNDELFLKHVMNVESIGKQMTDIALNKNEFNLNQISITDEELVSKSTIDEDGYFLNILIGVSQLEYPCKKLISNTLFRNNLIGVNHPFIIIGPYKLDWNDSSFVKLKCDMFRAASAVMCYQYHTIRGKANVKSALLTIARVCTYWNSHLKFSKFSCNCHHFIKYLLNELQIQGDFTCSHPTLVYLLDRIKLVKQERIIPWRFQSSGNSRRNEFIKTVQDNEIQVVYIPKKDYVEIIVKNLNQLKLLQNLFDTYKQSTKFETQEQVLVTEIDICIDSYLMGYQLRNQPMKPLDYSQINQFNSQSFNKLEYPLLNGFFDWTD